MSSTPPPSDARSVNAGVRVLLVEDDPDARDVYTLLLGAGGASVVAVASVPEARRALANDAFDVLVSDIGLPDEDGYVLIAEVRSGHPSMPSIAITAFGSDHERTRALEAGFNVFLTKPIGAVALGAEVAALVRRPSPMAFGGDPNDVARA